MLWGLMNKIVTIVFPFIIRTVMIYSLGMRYVGLGSLFTSVLQVLSFAEMGIGGALVFNMYKPIANDDAKTICSLLNFYKKTYRYIGIIILVIGLAIMPFMDHLIAGDVPDDINIYLLFLIYLANNVLGYFLFAYKQALFTATQRVDIISNIGTVIQIVTGGLQIVALISLKNYYTYAIIISLGSCLNNLIVGYFADKKYPHYQCYGDIEKDELKEIKKQVGGMIFQRIGSIVLTSTDTIVISAFLGLLSLAMFQNYYYVFTALNALFAILQQSIIPSIGNSVANSTVEKNYNDFKKFNFIYLWITSWFSVCLLCLYQPFMEIWVGKKNMYEMGMVLLFVVYFFIYKWCDMLYVYQQACGIWWETRYVPLISAIINLVINIVLVKIIGLPGILISTIIAILFVYDVGYAKVLFKTYFSSIKNGAKNYWIRQVLYFFTAIIASLVTYCSCSALLIPNIYSRFIVNGIICTIVPNIIIYILWHNTSEFTETVSLLKLFARGFRNGNKNEN
jgi:O-antigen/teichoic acid export membrane protein